MKTTSSQEMHCFAALTLMITPFSQLSFFFFFFAIGLYARALNKCSEVWVCKSWLSFKADCVAKGRSLWPVNVSHFFC